MSFGRRRRAGASWDVETFLRRVLLALQPCLAVERAQVVAVEPHDARSAAEHLPVVVAHVVERRRSRKRPGPRVAVRRRGGRRASSVGDPAAADEPCRRGAQRRAGPAHDHALQVADAHVVRRDGEVVAAEIAACDRQVDDSHRRRISGSKHSSTSQRTRGEPVGPVQTSLVPPSGGSRRRQLTAAGRDRPACAGSPSRSGRRSESGPEAATGSGARDRVRVAATLEEDDVPLRACPR